MAAERGFDFLEGQWDALCRVPSKDGWLEGRSTLTASRVLDGLVSLEFFEGIYHGGTLKGLGLRAFNRETREWEHTWTDNLEPGYFHVWKGTFSDGKIDLFAEWNDEDGKQVRSRLTWCAIPADSAHWESARSSDGKHATWPFQRPKRPTPRSFRPMRKRLTWPQEGAPIRARHTITLQV